MGNFEGRIDTHDHIGTDCFGLEHKLQIIMPFDLESQAESAVADKTEWLRLAYGGYRDTISEIALRDILGPETKIVGRNDEISG